MNARFERQKAVLMTGYLAEGGRRSGSGKATARAR